MKNGIFLAFFLLQGLLVNGQVSSSDREYKAEVQFVFTGEVKNQYDSVFRVQYILDAIDLQYNISETKNLLDSTTYQSTSVLSGNYKNMHMEGNKVIIDMGILNRDKPFVPFEFKDEKGVKHKVTLKTPSGDIKDAVQYNLDQKQIRSQQ